MDIRPLLHRQVLGVTVPSRKQQPEPSLRARLLGVRLRALREDRGLTLRYVSQYVGADYTHVREVEHGIRTAHHVEVAALLDLYGVYEQAERGFLVGLARDAFRLRAWEDDFDAPHLDASTLDGLWLESASERTRCYSATLIPDLLCTPAYAEAVVPRLHGSQAPALGWRIQAYGLRQSAVFDRHPAVDVQVVIAEAALHRRVGNVGETWRAQLARLAKGDEPDVQVRVLPTAAYVPGMDGSFTVFELPHKYIPAVACRPHLDSVVIHEGRAGQWHADAFDRLWEAALPAAHSAQLIAGLMEDLSTHSAN